MIKKELIKKQKLRDFKTNLMVTIGEIIAGRQELGG